MSAFDSIKNLLQPTVLESLNGSMTPVLCRIWTGTDEGVFEDVKLEGLYPFDTLETLKTLIATSQDDERFMPKFTFVGFEKDGFLEPLDYVWIETGTADSKHTKRLQFPQFPLRPNKEFIAAADEKPLIDADARGRCTIEKLFPDLKVPTLYVYNLKDLINVGGISLTQANWYKYLYPYFPIDEVPALIENKDGNSTYASAEDQAFFQTQLSYVKLRETFLNKLNRYISSSEITLPKSIVLGLKYVRLQLALKPETKFNGCEMLFYETNVTKRRPYMRFIPAAGTALSRVYVSGILPIPDIDDPEIIKKWSQEESPTQGEKDYLMIKYVQRPSDGTTYPLYGTIRMYQDGSTDLVLQTPDKVRRLIPNDFRHFSSNLREAVATLPLNPDKFKLGMAAVVFEINTGLEGKEFTKSRLQRRLPFFSVFFQEIIPLNDSLISLRYKAVNNFFREDRVSTFLSQYVTDKFIKGLKGGVDRAMLTKVMEEFQLSEQDATEQISKWRQRSDTPAIVNPDENDFTENSNPGIDIHIYAEYPTYMCHVHRVDSYESFQRIYTLLSLLFTENDGLFTTSTAQAEAFTKVEGSLQTGELKEEATLPKSVAAVQTMAQSRLAAAFGEEDEDEDEETASVPVTAKVTATATTTTATTTTAATEEVTVSKLINPDQWFLKELKAADKDLFEFTPTTGLPYSRSCAANETRQPAVLTETQYQLMRRIYKGDVERGEIFFNEMPIKGKVDPVVPRGAMEITIVKYGSGTDKAHWYFCPEYFCLRDKLLVLEKDFTGTIPRSKLDGSPISTQTKPENTCPFCKGQLITETGAVEGKTVIRRKFLPKTSERPLYVRFVSGKGHPTQLAQPCCYKVNLKGKNTLRLEDVDKDTARGYFEHIKSLYETSGKSSADLEEGSAKSTASAFSASSATAFSASSALPYIPDPQPYEYIKYSINSPGYIFVKSNVHPLKPGQLGVLPIPFDKYFAQKSDSFIGEAKGTGTLRLRSNGAGFGRMGVEKGYRDIRIGREHSMPTESLFAVLAPLLQRESIEQVRSRFLELFTGEVGVRLFVNSNFGNLVQEFHEPSDLVLGVVRDEGNAMDRSLSVSANPSAAFISWVKANLRINVTPTNQYAVERIYKSYRRFITFLEDPKQPKELRHFSGILAESGLMKENSRGLQLIVLEWAFGDDKTSPHIRCSPYGFSTERHMKNDFAFVWRDSNGYYELLFHTKNIPAKGGKPASNETVWRWEHDNHADWPRIVNQRINEYMTQCASSYRSLYTPQQGIKSEAMLTVLEARELAGRAPIGLVRDSYNHACFLLYSLKSNIRITKDTPFVPLPVVDDGSLSLDTLLYLDIEDFTPAPADKIVEFYREKFSTIIERVPGYAPERLATGTSKDKEGEVIAIQLKNGVYIPARNPSAPMEGFKSAPIEALEWDLNRSLSKPCGSIALSDMTGERMKELYQTFRYMFAQWLTKNPAILKEIEEKILFSVHRWPAYEQRKRLDILLTGTIQSWIYADKEKWDMPAGFLRKNCLVQDKVDCTGTCVWREESSSGSGSCLLHTNSRVTVGTHEGRKHEVATQVVFSRRLIDELVSFPHRRSELLADTVSRIQTILEPIRIGNQYIIPERGASWFDILKLDWMLKKMETPQYYEEMSTGVKAKVKGQAKKLPVSVTNVIGPTSKYQLWTMDDPAELSRLLEFPLESAESLKNDSVVKEYVKQKKMAIGILDTANKDNPFRFYMERASNEEKTLVVVYDDDNIGLLIEKPGIITLNVGNLRGVLETAWNQVRTAVDRRVPLGKRKPATAITAVAPKEEEKTAAPIADTQTVAPVADTQTVAPVAETTVVEPDVTTETLEEETVLPPTPPSSPSSPIPTTEGVENLGTPINTSNKDNVPLDSKKSVLENKGPVNQGRINEATPINSNTARLLEQLKASPVSAPNLAKQRAEEAINEGTVALELAEVEAGNKVEEELMAANEALAKAIQEREAAEQEAVIKEEAKRKAEEEQAAATKKAEEEATKAANTLRIAQEEEAKQLANARNQEEREAASAKRKDNEAVAEAAKIKAAEEEASTTAAALKAAEEAASSAALLEQRQQEEEAARKRQEEAAIATKEQGFMAEEEALVRAIQATEDAERAAANAAEIRRKADEEEAAARKKAEEEAVKAAEANQKAREEEAQRLKLAQNEEDRKAANTKRREDEELAAALQKKAEEKQAATAVAALKAKQDEEAAAALLKKREEEEATARQLKEEAVKKAANEATAKKAANEIPSEFNNKMIPSKIVAGILLPTLQSSIYYPNFFQNQVTGQGCGRFALNNLFHCEKFIFTYSKTPTYEKTITLDEVNDVYQGFNKLKQINLAAICELNSLIFSRDTQTTLDPTLICKANEDFPIHVITTALNIIGHSIESYSDNDKITDIPNATTKANILGYIINYGKDHYVALRKISSGPYKDQFRYYNSLGGASNFKIFKTTADYVTDARANGKTLINILEVSAVVPEGYIRPNQLSGTKTFEGAAELKEAIIEKYRDNYKYELNNLDFAIELGKAFKYFTYNEDPNRVFSILFGEQSDELLTLLKNKEVQTDITLIIAQNRHVLPKILLYLGNKGIDIPNKEELELEEIGANENYAKEAPSIHYVEAQQKFAKKEELEKKKEIQETLAAKSASASASASVSAPTASKKPVSAPTASKKPAPVPVATTASKKPVPVSTVTEESSENENSNNENEEEDDEDAWMKKPKKLSTKLLAQAAEEEEDEDNSNNNDNNNSNNNNDNDSDSENENENENENEKAPSESKKPSPPKGRPLQTSAAKAPGKIVTPLVPINKGKAPVTSTIPLGSKPSVAATTATTATTAPKPPVAASTATTAPKPPVAASTATTAPKGKPSTGLKSLKTTKVPKKSALND